jgi:type II secretory pathway predicted ATPase ExeA
MRPSKAMLSYIMHFKLQRMPFEAGVHTGPLFLTSGLKRTLESMIDRVASGSAISLLSGPSGSGRTTMLLAAFQETPTFKDAVILSVRGIENEIPTHILKGLGIHPLKDHTTPLESLRRYLSQHSSELWALLVFLDDIEGLLQEHGDELNTLLRLRDSEQLPIQFVLAGGPEASSALKALIPSRLFNVTLPELSLDSLDRTETEAYLNHRLKSAGATKSLFSAHAIDRIHFYTKGRPLKINRLSDRCLQIAALKGDSSISRGLVDQVVRPDSSAQRFKKPSKGSLVAWSLLAIGPMVLAIILYPSMFDSERSEISPVVRSTGFMTSQEGTTLSSNPTSDNVQPSLEPDHSNASAPRDAVGEVSALGASSPPNLEKGSNELPAPSETLGLGPVPSESVSLQDALPIPAKSNESLLSWLSGTTISNDELERSLLRLWHPEMPSSAKISCQNASLVGLRCERFKGSVKALAGLNLPAVVEFKLPGGIQKGAVLRFLSPHQVSLTMNKEARNFELDEFSKDWSGKAVILWRPSKDMQTQLSDIQQEASPSELEWLRSYMDHESMSRSSHSESVIRFKGIGETPHLSDSDVSLGDQSCETQDGILSTP